MKVFRIGNSEVSIIEEALKIHEDKYRQIVQTEQDIITVGIAEYEAAHIRTTKALMKDQSLQELCERCLSYFWDRLSVEGTDNPDVAWLAEDMGLNERELVELFREAGFEEE